MSAESAERGYVVCFDVPLPTLENNTADAERVKQALKKKLRTDFLHIPFHIVKELPGQLREWNHRVRAVVFRDGHGWSVVKITDFYADTPLAGVAVDIGTTRVVLRLVDLDSRCVLGETGFDNPQSAVGSDVLTRIHHAKTAKGREELQTLLIEAFNRNLDDLCSTAGCHSGDIYLMAAAGNTSMTHLFLGLDPVYMIQEPYIPCTNAPEVMKASRLGLQLNPHARIYIFPNIGSYFGGDIIAGILYSGIHEKPDPSIMVDVGTNAEVVVGCSQWLIGCAGAAGPALEGGISEIGMTAGPGVIDRVHIDDKKQELHCRTIGGIKAVGICGSGMIDLVAALFITGKIDIRGKFVKEKCGERLFEKDGICCFILADREQSATGERICISQVDIDLLTSSKAAMYTILEVIVSNTAGLEFEDLARFYVAGTFGSFINPESAISIGMLPDVAREKFRVVGNAALAGAAKFLTERAAYEDLMKIWKNITYIELNVNQAFMNLFSGAKFYPHTDRSRFPSLEK